MVTHGEGEETVDTFFLFNLLLLKDLSLPTPPSVLYCRQVSHGNTSEG